MDNFNVPTALPPAVYDSVMQKLDEVAVLLAPFNIPLDDTSIARYSKLGPKTENYVNEAEAAVEANEAVLSPLMPVADFEADHKTYEQADAIEDKLLEIMVGPHNTAIVAGAASKKFADDAYTLFKGFARLNAKFKTIVEKLGERYKDNGPKPSKSAE